ncbi:N-acyl homoserine lactonase family protein [Diaphorobacter sp. HDW4A]|uniref:N-acyl homoserine lactonase family protein n=1 Tax=Diaphorobacter sp. HDW4A TaxID=2714924 RepID=UPI0014073D5E|nr:N-acyl homoserine lactonase family protein [Diaphorobacter sp. HDW4A]QIL79296.1 N-acyl homoserine lactonase family protein [Diaphorobacter sp. HDW4A]
MTPDTQHLEPFELLALRYAHHDRKRRDNFIDGDPHDGSMPLDYYLWVARNSQATYVIDTGFDACTAQKRGRTLLCDPGSALQSLGVEPATVQDVIVTHLHYDHIGNFGLFPKANFHLQDAEMAYATGRCMCSGRLRHPYEVEHITGMIRCLYQERVRFHQGDATLTPGLSVHLIGGHTLGLQCVRVWTRRGWVVLASDASHHYEHYETGRPFPNLVRLDDMIAGYDKLRALASSGDHIIPGHDPLVMQRYPAPSPQFEGLCVQLDLEPHKEVPLAHLQSAEVA